MTDPRGTAARVASIRAAARVLVRHAADDAGALAPMWRRLREGVEELQLEDLAGDTEGAPAGASGDDARRDP